MLIVVALVIQLISYNPETCQKVGEFQLLSLPEARPDINCRYRVSSPHMLREWY